MFFGLLLSLPGEEAAALIADLEKAGVQTAALIGEVVDESVGITVA